MMPRKEKERIFASIAVKFSLIPQTFSCMLAIVQRPSKLCLHLAESGVRGSVIPVVVVSRGALCSLTSSTTLIRSMEERPCTASVTSVSAGL